MFYIPLEEFKQFLKLLNPFQVMNYIKILLFFIILSIFYSFSNKSNYTKDSLNLKDSICYFIEQGIKSKEFPGVQVIAIQNNRIIIDSCFGYTTYEKTYKVNFNTLYDLASLTKCLGTTLMAMKLYDNGSFDDTNSIGYYIPKYDSMRIGGLPMTRFLTHSTGLISSLSLQYELLYAEGEGARRDNWFQGILDNKRTKNYKTFFGNSGGENLYIFKNVKYTDYVSKYKKDNHRQIGNQLYVSPKFYENIVDSSLYTAKKYPTGRIMYSDINFYYLRKVLEKISNTPIDKYLQDSIYSKLYLNKIGYTPLKKQVHKEDIAPTEKDILLRNELIHGVVHDEFCAIMGGVEGNAGLFSNARDIVPLCRELMDSTDNFFSGKTKKHFLSQPYMSEKNFRALGFQRRDSTEFYKRTSFGHSGFTGTFFQIEPTTETILIFLSNSIYPTRDNLKKIDERTYLQLWRLLNK